VAVYTEIADDELDAFVATYDIGSVTSVKGIAEGVENSNFLLHTSKAPLILTLYEKRVEKTDLPFFLGLMQHLAARGLSARCRCRARTARCSARSPAARPP
jgi:homoserine kinase type II